MFYLADRKFKLSAGGLKQYSLASRLDHENKVELKENDRKERDEKRATHLRVEPDHNDVDHTGYSR